MSTDFYGASFTQIAGYARASEADITFEVDNVTKVLAARQVTVTTAEEVKPLFLPGNKAVITTGLPTGQITIGALVGTDLASFITSFSDLSQMSDPSTDPGGDTMDGTILIVNMVSSSVTDTNLDVENNLKWKFYGNKLMNCQTSTEGENVLVATNLTIFSLNVKLEEPIA